MRFSVFSLLIATGETLNIVIYHGAVPTATGWEYLDDTTVDMTSHIPGSDEIYALVYVDTAGDVQVLEGTPVASVGYDDIPLVPALCTALAAVRMYAGQTAIAETDIIELRFPEHPHALSLDSDAANILDVSGMEIGLDVQDANTVLAGPTTGVANEPDFRALVLADLPAIALNDLSDVNTTGVGTGDIIYKSSGDWVDYPIGIGIAFANENGRIKIGNIAGGNYFEIDYSTGEITLIGDSTTFDDLLFPLIGENLESPASDITVDPDEASVVFNDTCTLVDYVTMNIQMSHRWKIGSVIEPHLHWWQASSDIPNWMIQYRWQIQGEAKTTAWTDVPYDSHAFTYSGGTLNQITSFGEITPPVGAGLSDIVQFRIWRDTDNDSGDFGGADPLVGDASAVQFDVHFEIDSFGSYERYEKDYEGYAMLESGDLNWLEKWKGILRWAK